MGATTMLVRPPICLPLAACMLMLPACGGRPPGRAASPAPRAATAPPTATATTGTPPPAAGTPSPAASHEAASSASPSSPPPIAPPAASPDRAPGPATYSGPPVLSAPASRLAVDFLNKVRPTVSIWYHQHLNPVDLSGGDASLEQRYAAMVGLPTQQLHRYPGSVTSWENHAFPGSTAFVVELPAGSLSEVAATRYAAAALTIL